MVSLPLQLVMIIGRQLSGRLVSPFTQSCLQTQHFITMFLYINYLFVNLVLLWI